MTCMSSFGMRLRTAAALAAFVLVALVGSRSQAAIISVDEFAAVFPTVSAAGSQFTLSDDDITDTSPDSAVGLSIDPITVDLTGWNPAPGLGTADAVGIVGGKITLTGSAGSATYDVAAATLTQIINNPIAVGYMQLSLNNLVNNGLQDGNGDDVVLASSMMTTISINGLKVTTNGVNGNATVPSLSTASLTAVPEPSTAVLGALSLLGLGVFCGCGKARRARTRG